MSNDLPAWPENTISESSEEKQRKKFFNCIVCDLPLNEPYSKYHSECATCKYCGNECGREIVENRVKESSKEMFHDYCHSVEQEKKFKQLPVTISQGDLDNLNVWNLMFDPNLNVSTETDQKNAEIAASKLYWSKDWNFEQRQRVLKKMEAVAAAFSICLSKDENKVRVAERDSNLVRNKENQRSLERIEIEKQRIRKREIEARKLSPALRSEDKAIKAMMALGMSYEQAVESIEEQKKKRTEKTESKGLIQ